MKTNSGHHKLTNIKYGYGKCIPSTIKPFGQLHQEWAEDSRANIKAFYLSRYTSTLYKEGMIVPGQTLRNSWQVFIKAKTGQRQNRRSLAKTRFAARAQ